MQSGGRAAVCGVVISVTLALLAGGCSTRVSHDDVVAAARGRAQSGQSGGDSTAASTLAPGADVGTALSGTGTGGASNVVGAPQAQAGSGAGTGGGTGRGQSASTLVPTAGGGAKSPIKVASVGTISGPVGAVLGPQLQGTRAWVRSVNAAGGLNGHLVRLTTVDDGGDPARHRAALQEQVEQEGVIAFVQNLEALTGEASVDYLNAKRVPVVGSDGGCPWCFTSPMYFPQSTSTGRYLNDAAIYGIVRRAAALGKRRWGVLACVEVQNCRQVFNDGGDVARKAGLVPVYRGQTSLAQPDFTAECLSARDAGVEILFIGLDQNSIGRVAQSCARVGFHPIYNLAGQLVFPDQPTNPNLAGTLATSTVFPWFQANTPASAEFQTAASRYLPGIGLSVAQALGWTTGKLFEKAGANLPEPPTREALLQGLWSIKGETLGGLTNPLTFTVNKPPKPAICWFELDIQGGKWVNNDGYRLNCR